MTPVRGLILQEAFAITCSDRQAEYGPPVECFDHAARIFNAVTGRDLTAGEIVEVMLAVKKARRMHNPRHRDSYVDGAAYEGIAYECALAEAK